MAQAEDDARARDGEWEMIENEGLISIIMAAYNAGRTIETAIRSVISQTYPNWELLVIDDCSTDSTALIAASLARADGRIRLLRNERNSGVSLTRKKGMENAQGAWIAVLDSDDAWTPEKLEKQLALAKSKDARLIFTGSAFMNDGGEALDWQLHVPETLCYRDLLNQNLISNSSVLVKAELYRKYYAAGDRMHEDYAIWLGMTRDGITAYGIDEPLLIYRIASASKSSNKLKSAKMQWNTYRYIGLHPVSAAYHMCWYTVKGLMKYRNLK